MKEAIAGGLVEFASAHQYGPPDMVQTGGRGVTLEMQSRAELHQRVGQEGGQADYLALEYLGHLSIMDDTVSGYVERAGDFSLNYQRKDSG